MSPEVDEYTEKEANTAHIIETGKQLLEMINEFEGFWFSPHNLEWTSGAIDGTRDGSYPGAQVLKEWLETLPIDREGNHATD